MSVMGIPGGAAPAGPQSQDATPGALPNAGAPGAGGMSTPQPKLGEQEKAKASIQMAAKVLTMASAAFEPMSEEAKAIRKALDVISKSFGGSAHEAKDLVPAEISQLMSGMKPPGGAPGGPPQPGAM